MKALSGTFPVLCTPFRDDGTIDEDDFISLIEFVIASSADGCVYPGVASECDMLLAEERAGMIDLLGRVLGGRIPSIVGASEAQPEEVLQRIREGAAAGAHAAMVMAPRNLGRDVAAQNAFFEVIARGTSLPIMLQNAPEPIGAGLSPDEVAAVANAVGAIRYVKEETLPCGQNLTRIRNLTDRSINGVFGGAGGRYITDELARGSLGSMPASELTDIHVRIVRAWRSEDHAEARRLFMVSMPLLNFQAVFRMQMTKATLKRRGVIRHTFVRAKGPVMDAGDRRELDALIDQIAPDLETRLPGRATTMTSAA